ncbi:hypothetical protein CMQ_1148 [Grosmannia clavigera kw1407]|uniref:Uncharacterized protein n=1 Tax=Grosmannia clavigera (strain kw1407 / UAMH 11150) TaxID=655863 RepID=F0XEN1_GROCL|nr:uncharacterized protein CMQ_1148 [Grosmannia clavigera kw1407]EFX04220.1 hypothetical protein CMQ_1148 [Grosmannia clavigera kw1407]
MQYNYGHDAQNKLYRPWKGRFYKNRAATRAQVGGLAAVEASSSDESKATVTIAHGSRKRKARAIESPRAVKKGKRLKVADQEVVGLPGLR